VGGFPGWGRIYQMIHPEENPTLEDELRSIPRKRSFLGRLFRSVLLVLSVFLISSCSNKNGGVSSQRIQPDAGPAKAASMKLPGANTSMNIGEILRVELIVPDTVRVDSIQLFLRGKKQGTLSETLSGSLETGDLAPGKAGLRAKLFFNSGSTETHSRQITLLSDIVPDEYGYRVVNEFPHDVKAFTQGLQFHDGFLYEVTGNYNQSSLRKVKLENGEIIKIRNLDGDLFGEGITVFQNKIYQLTYKSQVGFVYDKSTFEEIQKVYYQNREGWGLTHNGSELIMSDGTHVIYFLDPELFTINRQIEVYHNRGIADSLNELEYIDGKIWANRYYTDEIVIIDPASGKVEGRINLKGILPSSERKASTDVLNGIAWDSDADRLFVTGKYWPKLYEIEIYRR
jgi:glutamine cyclotransferase